MVAKVGDKWASRDAIGVRRGDAGPRQVHSGVQVHQGECRSRGGIARLPDGLRAELTRKPRLFVSRLAPLGGPDPQEEKRSIEECVKRVDECNALRYTYAECKRGQVNMRSRIQGSKGY